MPRATPGELSRRRRFLVLAICCASVIVVVMMDISIVNVALPAIHHDLHASESGLQWTVDAYTLVLASFLVLAGSTADRVGRRRVFQTGLAAFGAGSLLCGLAPGTGWLVAARALQAVGGTMLNPVAMAIVATTFTRPAERARAIGVFGSMTGLSLALGPILGGALVDRFGWHSIFWINVPIVAAAIACTALFVPESRAARARRFDPVGQALVILMLGSVIYAIIGSQRLGWASPVILGLLAVAVLSALGIFGYEPRRADPLLELRLFRSVPFSSAILMALWALLAWTPAPRRAPVRRCRPQNRCPGSRPLGVPGGLVGEVGDAALDGLGPEEAEGFLAAGLAEEALAGPERDREQFQPQLVDQVVLHQGVYELEAGGDDDFPAELLPQLRDLAQHLAPQDRRVVPGGTVEGRGHDVFGQAVQPVRQLATARWPPRSEPLIAPPAQQEGLGAQRLVQRELADLWAVLDQADPAAAPQALIASRILDDPVQRDVLAHDDLPHAGSPSAGAVGGHRRGRRSSPALLVMRIGRWR